MRVEFLNWVIRRFALPWTGNQACTIDLWRRVPHTDQSLPGGPELDFVLSGDRCVVFGEAKLAVGGRARTRSVACQGPTPDCAGSSPFEAPWDGEESL